MGSSTRGIKASITRTLGVWRGALVALVVGSLLGGVNAQTAPTSVGTPSVTTFVTLKKKPAGIAVGGGRIMVATAEPAGVCPPSPSSSAAPSNAAGGGPASPNIIAAYKRDGTRTATVPLDCALMPPSSVFPPVPLGMTTDAAGSLFVIDYYHGDVLRYDLPLTSTSTPSQTYDLCGGYIVAFGFSGTFCYLTDIVVGPDGFLYVSDSGAGWVGVYDGKIYRLNPVGGVSSIFFEHGALDQAGATSLGPRSFPALGGSSLAFAPSGAALMIGHTADDRILRLEMDCATSSCAPGDITEWAESVDGVNDLVFDNERRLWASAGQQDEVVALRQVPPTQCDPYFNESGNPTTPCGKVVERRGSFKGATDNGTLRGMLLPHGLAISRGYIYTTQRADPTLHMVPDTPNGWADVERRTVTRFAKP